ADRHLSQCGSSMREAVFASILNSGIGPRPMLSAKLPRLLAAVRSAGVGGEAESNLCSEATAGALAQRKEREKMADRLREKTALVIGGHTGIGREVCRLFAAEGASVAVADF